MNKKNCYFENITMSVIIGLLIFDIFMFILLNYNINIKLELSITDFINIFIALIITAIIPLSIGKVIEKNKSSKELLIFEINNFLNDLDILLKFISSDKEKNEKINNITDIYIKILGNQYEIIKDNCEKYFKKTDLNDFIEKYLDFRGAITDTIRNDDFEFNSSYISQTLKSKLKLQKEIEKLKFEIA